VNISDARDDRLIEQYRLERPSRRDQAAVPLNWVKIPRLGTQSLAEVGLQACFVGAEQHPSKPARVAISQVGSILQREFDMTMRVTFGSHWDDRQLTCHAQMCQQMTFVGKVQNYPLASPADPRNRLPQDTPFPSRVPP